MTKTNKVLGIIIVILLLIIGFQFFNSPKESTVTETKNVEVAVPKIDGVFAGPQSEQELPSKGVDSVIYQDKILVVASKADRELLDRYKKASKDTIAQLKILLDATRERDYLYKFEDDHISLSMTATAQGKVLGISPKYSIKETSVTVPQTTTVITKTEPAKLKDVVSLNGHVGFLVGGSYQQDLQNKDAAYGLSGGVRLEKITILGSINTNKQAGVTALIEL